MWEISLRFGSLGWDFKNLGWSLGILLGIDKFGKDFGDFVGCGRFGWDMGYLSGILELLLGFCRFVWDFRSLAGIFEV